MKESRKEDTSLFILIFLIKYGFGHISSLELGTLKEKALFKHPQQKMWMEVLNSLAADIMRDRKYMIFQIPAGAGSAKTYRK